VRTPKLPPTFAALVAAALVPLAAGAQAPPAGTLLEGTAAWDPAVIQKWAKRFHQLEIEAQPSYPNRDMTAQLNPEFARRVDAVVAIYRAVGGSEIGIVPRTGGLRTEQMQRELYRKGRRIRDGRRADGTARDGTRQEDWVARTDANLGRPLFEQVPVLDRRGRPTGRFRQGRQIGWPGEWDPEQRRHVTVTNAWGPEGWHAYGVAVDFVRYVNGRPTWEAPSPFQSAEWSRTTYIAGQLGLRFGLWWQRPDPPHVEWHPKLPDVPTQIPGAPNGTGTFAGAPVRPGTALTAAQTDAGYRWKLPRTIYHRTFSYDNQDLPETVEVFELDAEGEWIRLKRYRKIVRIRGMGWNGEWITYDPPARLIPTYIPVMNWGVAPLGYGDDPHLRTRSRLTKATYFETDGPVVTRTHREETGEMAHCPNVHLTDLCIQGWFSLWTGAGDAVRWATLRQSRVYTVDADLALDYERQPQAIHTRERTVDSEGYTFDYEGNSTGGISGFVNLDFTWDRDTGAIGVHNPVADADRDGPYRLRPVRTWDNGLGFSITPSLPEGAFDRENPPDWTPPNPRPMNP
jgi:hypothetical protein